MPILVYVKALEPLAHNNNECTACYNDGPPPVELLDGGCCCCLRFAAAAARDRITLRYCECTRSKKRSSWRSDKSVSCSVFLSSAGTEVVAAATVLLVVLLLLSSLLLMPLFAAVSKAAVTVDIGGCSGTVPAVANEADDVSIPSTVFKLSAAMAVSEARSSSMLGCSCCCSAGCCCSVGCCCSACCCCCCCCN